MPPSEWVPATDFQLPAVDGSQVHLSDLRGKVVLLNFWATWCPPCEAEMPDLNALHERYGVEHDFVVLGLNMQESQAVVSVFADQYGLSFPLLLDLDGAVSARGYGIRSMPTSIIVDREGRIRDRWTGQISKSSMLARLQRVW
jgi:cytochrome c biogenesis protein CcmG, thiol:disulfide interchange protein DsbE